MLNLRFTAGVGVGISGACGPPLVWRWRKPLPSALRSSAALTLGLVRLRAPVPEHRLPVLGLCLRPPWMPPSVPFSLYLLFLLVRVALKLRSLRFHSLRLCRIAVFLIQTNVSLTNITSTAARSRPRNGGELPAKHAPLIFSMLVLPTFTSQSLIS